MKHYIRFGDIPENETSGIWRRGERVGEEKGVSVYDAIMIDGEWRIVLPSELKVEIGFDLYSFIERSYDERNYPNEHHLPMYLVQGDEVGYGMTNEPLLKNVKIIKKLK